MSGSVIAHKGKRGTSWRVKYRDAEGRQVMETVVRASDGLSTGQARKHAEAELRDRLHRVERKGWRKPSELTFAEYAETWFREGERKRHWREKTIRVYTTVLERLVAFFGPMPLTAIRPRDVAAYVSRQSEVYAPATVNRDLSILHDILGTAESEELIDRNPASRAERPKIPQKRWRILEPSEVGLITQHFEDEQHRLAFLTLVQTGLRRHEFKNLRWRDVDLSDNSLIRVRASKSEEGIRSIAIGPMLANELWRHRQRSAFQGDDDLAFCHSERGTVFRADLFATALRSAMEAAGLEGAERIRPFHDLRHTAITHDAAAGSSEIAVMAKAGHASMNTTKTYLHLAGRVFREEAEKVEQRLMGGVSTNCLPDSDDLSAPERTEGTQESAIGS